MNNDNFELLDIITIISLVLQAQNNDQTLQLQQQLDRIEKKIDLLLLKN